MRSYSLHEARAHFSSVVDRALAGEPQRVTRHGKDAVVIVSEAEWKARGRGDGTLGSLLAAHARRPSTEPTLDDAIGDAFPQRRPLGSDFD